MYVGFFIFYFIGQDGIGRTEESARKTERNARMLPNLIFFLIIIIIIIIANGF